MSAQTTEVGQRIKMKIRFVYVIFMLMVGIACSSLTNSEETSLDVVVDDLVVPNGDSQIDKLATSTQTLPTSSSEIQNLKLYALELINKDREKHGVAPVVMGSDMTAQLHAEESLQHTYLAHWFLSGEKPYMVYSRNGGNSYVSENGASGGGLKMNSVHAGCRRLFLAVAKRFRLVT